MLKKVVTNMIYYELQSKHVRNRVVITQEVCFRRVLFKWRAAFWVTSPPGSCTRIVALVLQGLSEPNGLDLQYRDRFLASHKNHASLLPSKGWFHVTFAYQKGTICLRTTMYCPDDTTKTSVVSAVQRSVIGKNSVYKKTSLIY